MQWMILNFGDNKMSAPQKNQNAVKEEADKASSFLHVRAVPRDKSSWVRAANRDGKKLAAWVTDTLNQNSQ